MSPSRAPPVDLGSKEISPPTPITPPSFDFVHPHEWGKWRKWSITLTVAYCDCLTFLVSMMLAPAVPQVLAEFRPNGDDVFLGSFCVAVYILGFCVGSLLFAPLTDIYGRAAMLRTCVVFFVSLTVGCALSTSLGMLIGFRFLTGIFGGAPMAIGGAVVADMYPSGQRGRPMACYTVGTMLGPTLGPVLDGIINGTLGWRWIFWVAAMLAGVCLMGLLLILRETHLPSLSLRGRVANESGTYHRLRARFIPVRSRHELSVLATLSRTSSLPVRLIARSPTVSVILVLMIAFNGIVNIILSSLGSVYQSQYHFTQVTAGLSYLGIGFGGLTALSVARPISGLLGRRLRSSGDTSTAEHHLPLIMTTLPLATVGLLWSGWAIQAVVHWVVPMLGLYVFRFAYMSVRLSTQLFLVEAVPGYSASALAAHTVASSIGGAFIPLCTFPMYNKLGYGWGNTLIGLVDLALAAIPLGLYISSERSGTHVRIDLHL